MHQPAAAGAPGTGPSGATQPAHTHPLSIAVHALRGVPVFGVLYLIVVDNDARSWAAALILGLPVIAALSIGAAALSWSRTWYFFDESGDFRLDSGVLFRKQRRLALSRLQSVDIVRPALARLVGMASVRVEVAGAGDSVAAVEYLPDDAAEALRSEVLTRASGVGEPLVEQPEDVRLRVSTGDLITSLLLRGSTVVAIVLTVLGVTGVLAISGPAGFLVVGVGVFVPVLTVLSEFTSYYGFTLARSEDGVRLRSGLISTVGNTVPPGRVHAIEFSQPILWRRRDWVRVSLNVAGSRGEGDSGGSRGPRVLVPVATADEARDIVAMILPDWDPRSVPLNPAGDTARWRSPVQHRRLRYGQGEEVLVATRGRFVRRTAIIAHARVQSLRLIQGPLQRRLGLATVRADTVPGPVSVAASHIPAQAARELADDEARRMRIAAERSGPERWRRGMRPAPESGDAVPQWAPPNPADAAPDASAASPGEAAPQWAPPDPAAVLPAAPDTSDPEPAAAPADREPPAQGRADGPA